MLILLLAAACLFGAAKMNEPLRQERKEYRISQADPLENAPPLVVFTTVAFGGFRGILADMLWIRAAQLQDEGKYIELVQLSDWITKLEPRFTAVWAFHAWNLAYNVSVLFDKPEDRWRWVQHGIHLLRNEGLTYNPGDARLLYELAWIFQHKLGGSSDSANAFYKRAWAAEMMELIDGPRPDFDACIKLQGDPTDQSPAALRVRRMVDEYKLDPAIMKTVDDKYGPFDWRLPQAHAVYWAWRSRQEAEGFDITMADRMIFQSLVDAFWQGHLFFDPAKNVFVPSPNLDLLPHALKAFDDALTDRPGDETIMASRKNFLREATLVLFTYHRNDEARKIYERLVSENSTNATPADFDTLVVQTYESSIASTTERNAPSVVENALYQSLFWQSLGDADRAAGYDQLAHLLWNHYTETKTELPPLEEIRNTAKARVQQALNTH